METLRIWTGPIRSEKTTRALRYARRLQERGFHIPAVLRPLSSVRDHERASDGSPAGFLITQAGERFPATELTSADQLLWATTEMDVCWIDEPMLFPDEQLVFEVVQRIRRSTPVIISGCAATSELEPFGESLPKLLAVADYVEMCCADCENCNRMLSATRSHCLVQKTGQVLVGAAESYRPLCPKCWKKSQTV